MAMELSKYSNNNIVNSEEYLLKVNSQEQNQKNTADQGQYELDGGVEQE